MPSLYRGFLSLNGSGGRYAILVTIQFKLERSTHWHSRHPLPNTPLAPG